MVPEQFSASLHECAYRIRTSRMHAVLDILGDPWNLPILGEVLGGVQRFDALVERLGVSRPALSKRLDTLIAAGCLRKTPYCTHPPRYEYEVTAMGRDVRPIVQLLQQWDRDWHAGAPAAPEACRYCHHPLQIRVNCAHCRQLLDAYQVKPLFYAALPAQVPSMPAYRRTRHQVASKECEWQPAAIPAQDWLQDRWSALILGGMMMGLQRYGDLLAVLAVAPNILSGRLEVLLQAGLLERREDGRYRLAARGLALYPAIMAMRDWGERWLQSGPTFEQGWGLLHLPCGEWLKLAYTCEHCGHAC